MLQRVRQQLILAQVRIMELEDVRDETAARLAEHGQLLRAAQSLADQKMDEAAHAENNRAGLQAQFEHLQHIQQGTSETLATTQARLAATEQALAQEKQAVAELTAQVGRLTTGRQHLEARLGEAAVHAGDREQRLTQLDADLRRLKSSRSWRWTAGLRSLERLFRGKQP